MSAYHPPPAVAVTQDDVDQMVNHLLLLPLSTLFDMFGVPSPPVAMGVAPKNSKESYRLRVIDAFLAAALAFGSPTFDPNHPLRLANAQPAVEVEIERNGVWAAWNAPNPKKYYLSGRTDYYLHESGDRQNWLGYIEAKAKADVTLANLRQNYAELVSLLGKALDDLVALPANTVLYAYGCLTNGEQWRFTRCWAFKSAAGSHTFDCRAEQMIDITGTLSSYQAWQPLDFAAPVTFQNFVGGASGQQIEEILIRLVHVFAGEAQ